MQPDLVIFLCQDSSLYGFVNIMQGEEDKMANQEFKAASFFSILPSRWREYWRIWPKKSEQRQKTKHSQSLLLISW